MSSEKDGSGHSHSHGHGHEDKHDHKEHDHKDCSGHDHKEHDHKEHDHKGCDHGHDHKEHDHKEHKHDEHKGHDHGHDHDKEKACDHPSHDHDSHDHVHSHDHDGPCDHPSHDHAGLGHGPALSKPEDVKDEEMPAWKKRALESKASATDAPFGMTWGVEGTTTATDASKKKEEEEKSKSTHDHDHGHSHEHMDHPGDFNDRPTAMDIDGRDYEERSFTVGLGGPVGSGKTALMLALCRKLRDRMSIAAVTNDIFTREDGEFLTRNEALSKNRIVAVETGGCPHAAIREDISANLTACERLSAKIDPLDIILLESGGDNLAANFSPELADFTLYVIDVSGGDKVPRKGGPGVTQSDILVVNKTDLAVAVGASLEVMARDAKRMRGDGPTVFAQARENLGLGVDDIINLILKAWNNATGKPIPP